MKIDRKVNNFDEFLNECWSPEMGNPGVAIETEPGQQFEEPQGAQGASLPPPSMPHTVLVLQTTLKLAHWQTTSFAQHEAFGKIYDEIEGLGDTLVEVYIGKYGNRQVMPGSVIGLQNSTMEEMPMVADVCLAILNMSCDVLLDKEKDMEIITIVDEIRGQLQKLKYLFTLAESREWNQNPDRQDDAEKAEAIMAEMNKMAEEKHGEFGFATLDASAQEDVIGEVFKKHGFDGSAKEILNKLDQLAEDLRGEFGFATLDDQDMKMTIDEYIRITK